MNNCPCLGMPLIEEGWIIPHPGDGHPIRCKTFEEAMEKWFEGFNIPKKVGILEDFHTAYRRVSDYLDNKRKT